MKLRPQDGYLAGWRVGGVEGALARMPGLGWYWINCGSLEDKMETVIFVSLALFALWVFALVLHQWLQKKGLFSDSFTNEEEPE